jgi:hypothetical protein
MGIISPPYPLNLDGSPSSESTDRKPLYDKMKNRGLIAVVLLFIYSRASLQATSCYYPDGTFAEFDSPCFPDQAESICCGQGHTCMSNNLCRWPPSEMPYPLAYIRGSCTDPSCKLSCLLAKTDMKLVRLIFYQGIAQNVTISAKPVCQFETSMAEES